VGLNSGARWIVVQEKTINHSEKGTEVPSELIDPDALRGLIEEFVTRDGADWDEAGCTLEDKVQQVLQQLRNKKIVIVFDHISQTANLVVCGKR
jgi:uncharacterized protein